MNTAPPTASKPLFLGLTILLIVGFGYWAWSTKFAPVTCDPKTSLAKLHALKDKGIRNTGQGSSLTNLLWIYVGPKWHAISMEEKRSIDKIVRCAAQTIDDQGKPNWQAAYYNFDSGKMAALTSLRYGFRLKADESSDAPGWTIP